MKRIKRLFVCTMLLTMLGSLSVAAQTLVVRFANGTTDDVELTADFDAIVADGKVIFTSDGTTKEYQRASITGFSYRETRGDVNRDNAVDVADIATIISIMAGDFDTGKAPANAKGVDLGLPSGTLWANMNIGATSPQEDGLYFAWGETTGYTSNTSDGRKFDWASYKWMTQGQSDWKFINKYQIADGMTDACWYQYNWDIVDYEFIGDGKKELDLTDDAAYANWGGDWRMPTIDDFTELLDNTTNEWITVGSVKGRKFTSKKKNADGTYNSIFFPAAGCRDDASIVGQGTNGYYWSLSLHTSSTSSPRVLYFHPGSASTYYYFRYNGHSVRAVLRKK